MSDDPGDGRDRRRDEDAAGDGDGDRDDPLGAEEHGFRPAEVRDAAPEDGPTSENDPTPKDDPAPEDAGGTADPDGTGGAGSLDSPMGDLAREVERRRRDREAGTDEPDPFEDVDVGDLDGEAVWDAIADAEADAGADADVAADPDAGAAGQLGEESDVERVPRDDPGAVRPDHVVPKREYCQRCPYLSEPPRVVCGHEGTDIVEVVDSEHFRVRGCPMVDGDGSPGGPW